MYKSKSGTLFIGKKLIYLPTCQSTNDEAADLLRLGKGLEGTVVITDYQSAGRGQRGNQWLAQAGENFTLSLILRPNFLTAVQQFHLNIAVSVGIYEFFASFLNEHLKIKWPNDLLKDGLKLGGVLIESVPVRSQQNAVWAIIGIGLNTQPSENLCASVGHEIAALSMQPSAQPLDRNRLCAQLVDGLIQALQEFQQHGLKNFIAPWQQYHAYANQVVSITEQGRLLHEGIASGIDADGRLLLQSLTTPTQFTAIAVGDVSLRLA